MRVLSANDLMAVWESALAEPMTGRALRLLSEACPGQTYLELAQLSIGRRDAMLLTLREQTFGPRVEGGAECPRCRERVELELHISDLLVAEPETLHVSIDSNGREFRFRLPGSNDLLAIAGSRSIEEGCRKLLESCVVESHGPVSTLSDAEVETVSRLMSDADPQANMDLALSCPACDHQWRIGFEVMTFFWNEIEAWAMRMLRDVHTLAMAYGWRESDILAMSDARRRCYLEMLSA